MTFFFVWHISQKQLVAVKSVLAKFYVKDIKTICLALGLPSNGVKDQCIESLIRYIQHLFDQIDTIERPVDKPTASLQHKEGGVAKKTKKLSETSSASVEGKYCQFVALCIENFHHSVMMPSSLHFPTFEEMIQEGVYEASPKSLIPCSSNREPLDKANKHEDHINIEMDDTPENDNQSIWTPQWKMENIMNIPIGTPIQVINESSKLDHTESDSLTEILPPFPISLSADKVPSSVRMTAHIQNRYIYYPLRMLFINIMYILAVNYENVMKEKEDRIGHFLNWLSYALISLLNNDRLTFIVTRSDRKPKSLPVQLKFPPILYYGTSIEEVMPNTATNPSTQKATMSEMLPRKCTWSSQENWKNRISLFQSQLEAHPCKKDCIIAIHVLPFIEILPIKNWLAKAAGVIQVASLREQVSHTRSTHKDGESQADTEENLFSEEDDEYTQSVLPRNILAARRLAAFCSSGASGNILISKRRSLIEAFVDLIDAEYGMLHLFYRITDCLPYQAIESSKLRDAEEAPFQFRCLLYSPHITSSGIILPLDPLPQLLKQGPRISMEDTMNRHFCSSKKVLTNTINSKSKENDLLELDDEEMTVSAFRLSLRCPLSMLPLKIPVKSKYCENRHVGSFDASSIAMLLAAKKKKSAEIKANNSHGPEGKPSDEQIWTASINFSDLSTFNSTTGQRAADTTEGGQSSLGNSGGHSHATSPAPAYCPICHIAPIYDLADLLVDEYTLSILQEIQLEAKQTQSYSDLLDEVWINGLTGAWQKGPGKELSSMQEQSKISSSATKDSESIPENPTSDMKSSCLDNSSMFIDLTDIITDDEQDLGAPKSLDDQVIIKKEDTNLEGCSIPNRSNFLWPTREINAENRTNQSRELSGNDGLINVPTLSSDFRPATRLRYSPALSAPIRLSSNSILEESPSSSNRMVQNLEHYQHLSSSNLLMDSQEHLNASFSESLDEDDYDEYYDDEYESDEETSVGNHNNGRNNEYQSMEHLRRNKQVETDEALYDEIVRSLPPDGINSAASHASYADQQALHPYFLQSHSHSQHNYPNQPSEEQFSKRLKKAFPELRASVFPESYFSTDPYICRFDGESAYFSFLRSILVQQGLQGDQSSTSKSRSLASYARQGHSAKKTPPGIKTRLQSRRQQSRLHPHSDQHSSSARIRSSTRLSAATQSGANSSPSNVIPYFTMQNSSSLSLPENSIQPSFLPQRSQLNPEIMSLSTGALRRYNPNNLPLGSFMPATPLRSPGSKVNSHGVSQSNSHTSPLPQSQQSLQSHPIRQPSGPISSSLGPFNSLQQNLVSGVGTLDEPIIIHDD